MRRLPTFSKHAMKTFRSTLAAVAGMFVLGILLSCETHKDPFSGSNSSPVITNFTFRPDVTLPDLRLRSSGDSLKFKAGEAYAIALQYEDAELKNKDRNLRGSGKPNHAGEQQPQGVILECRVATLRF